mmetsp:Transcript_11626/g.13782  ORF Transcript_11626/g.13782 Transcript_11626/m.13782 type:complete len:83 (-) Transcript_11626:272-520(-)
MLSSVRNLSTDLSTGQTEHACDKEHHVLDHAAQRVEDVLEPIVCCCPEEDEISTLYFLGAFLCDILREISIPSGTTFVGNVW